MECFVQFASSRVSLGLVDAAVRKREHKVSRSSIANALALSVKPGLPSLPSLGLSRRSISYKPGRPSLCTVVHPISTASSSSLVCLAPGCSAVLRTRAHARFLSSPACLASGCSAALELHMQSLSLVMPISRRCETAKEFLTRTWYCIL